MAPLLPLPTTTILCVVLLLLLGQTTNVSCQFHLIPTAVSQGAVCLDGSPPAYDFDAAGKGARNWVVYLQGSGWCVNSTMHQTPDGGSVQSCADRSKTKVGSSHQMQPLNFSQFPVLSPHPKDSFFHDWNRVAVRSCDGGSFSGDADKPDPVTGLHYRGARIFRAVIEELMTKGLRNARNVLLAGGSSGGLGVMVHCDRFRRLFSGNVRVKCYADSSLFLHVRDPRRAAFFDDVFGNVVSVHRLDKALPGRCTKEMGARACLFPQNLVRYIESPFFILNSAFDAFQVANTFSKALHDRVMHHMLSQRDLALLRDFRGQTIGALPPPSRTKGYLITSLFMHSLGSAQGYKGPMFPGRKSKSFESALVDWFFDRTTNVHLIDPSKEPFYSAPRV